MNDEKRERKLREKQIFLQQYKRLEGIWKYCSLLEWTNKIQIVIVV